MKKAILILLALGGLFMALGQTVSTPSPGTPAVNTAALPGITVGFGPSWTRGGTSPYSVDGTVAFHIGSGQWYSWTNISTPIQPTAPGTQPVASTITTGGAWIPAQSASGSVSLVVIMQTGFTMLQATSTVAPAITGTVGVAFKIGKSHTFVMPYAKAANATTGSTSGALATAVFQPGVQFLYGFGGK